MIEFWFETYGEEPEKLLERPWAEIVELLEWRSQRLSRENHDSNQTLYETDKADKVTYVNDLSAFGIKQVTEDGR